MLRLRYISLAATHPRNILAGPKVLAVLGTTFRLPILRRRLHEAIETLFWGSLCWDYSL